MSEQTFAERAQELRNGIARTRQTLRDEHFPYEEGKAVYSALHEALRIMDVFLESFVQWGVRWETLDEAEIRRFVALEHIHDGIVRELG